MTQARSLLTSASACFWETFNCASVSSCCFRLSNRSQTKIRTSAIPSNQIAIGSYVLSQLSAAKQTTTIPRPPTRTNHFHLLIILNQQSDSQTSLEVLP